MIFIFSCRVFKLATFSGRKQKKLNARVVSNPMLSTSLNSSTQQNSPILLSRPLAKINTANKYNQSATESSITMDPICEVQMPVFFPDPMEDDRDGEQIYCVPDELNLDYPASAARQTTSLTSGDPIVTNNTSSPIVGTEYEAPEDNVYADSELFAENIYADNELSAVALPQLPVVPVPVPPVVTVQIAEADSDSSDLESEWDSVSSDSDPVYSDLPDIISKRKTHKKKRSIKAEKENNVSLPQGYSNQLTIGHRKDR